jgi:2'-5' RNA ligase
MRLFIAADLPEDAREAIAAEQRRIASALGDKEREPLPGHRSAKREGGRRVAALKWVKPDLAHLTLVFLGNVEEARVPAVVEAVGGHVDAAPFEISLETIGAFPARGAPRVLWIGVVDGATRLSELQRELAERIAAIGIPLEDRPFHPHLTLARWRESRPADRERALAAAPLGVVARACVDGATLYQSRLSPAGPSYTALARANLTNVRGVCL